jgi:hypothetical protein
MAGQKHNYNTEKKKMGYMLNFGLEDRRLGLGLGMDWVWAAKTRLCLYP